MNGMLILGILCVIVNLGLALAIIRSIINFRRIYDLGEESIYFRYWPKISLISPACNEEKTIEAAGKSLLEIDYPNLEIILVNDRSTDKTGEIIDRLAKKDSRIQPVHVSQLPKGWLGKVHAMHRGAQIASGDYLLFTDADIHYEAETLKKAIAYCERERLGHLTILPKIASNGFLLNAVIAAFAIGYVMAVNPHRIGPNRSDAFAGFGAFGMVRREAFAKTGGLAWLKMEILDDAGLGLMMARQSGWKSRLVTGPSLLRVKWYTSVPGMIKGLEKNFIAMMNYKPLLAIIVSAFSLLPPITLILALFHPAIWVNISAGALIITLIQMGFRLNARMQHPTLSSLVSIFSLPILGWTLLRSMLICFWKKGITWRDTYYPLSQLKAEQRVRVFVKVDGQLERQKRAS